MKFLFIYFNKEFRPRTAPSISILETILKQDGHETVIFDTSFYKEFMEDWVWNTVEAGVFKMVNNLKIPVKTTSAYEDLENLVFNFDPDLIGFTYYTLNKNMQEKLLVPLKKAFPKIKIIAGGPHVCINPEGAINEPYIDMICYGEGENLIRELCNKIENNDYFFNIKGLWIKGYNRCRSIYRNGMTDLVNINIIPFQDWDSYDPIQIYGLFNGKVLRMGHVEYTRGCPYDCNYCGSGSNRKAYEKDGKYGYVRHKNPYIFIQECMTLKLRYDLEIFYFIDGSFGVMPKKDLRILSKLYSEYVNLPFICLVNPLSITDEVAKLMAEMGCVHVSMGIESGIEKYRKEIFNRHMTDKRIIQAVKSLKKYRIQVGGYNIIGVSGMDREHVFKTIKLNKEAGVDHAMVSKFIPFPDSKLTKMLIKKGLIDPKDIVELADGSYQTVEIADMSREEIEGLYHTFNFYVKLPEKYYHLIEQYEKDLSNSDLREKLINLIKREVQND